MTEDLTTVDFFRDGRLTDDPYRFYEAFATSARSAGRTTTASRW